MYVLIIILDFLHPEKCIKAFSMYIFLLIPFLVFSNSFYYSLFKYI